MPRSGVLALPEYAIWSAMIQRCTNPKDKQFKQYGGRGITVCPSFLADMGSRPDVSLSVERMNNDGPYSPDNCKWGTRTEQNRNRRSCRPLTAMGRTQLMTDWARETGISVATIHKRLKRGWDVSRAVTP
jgi:hypothetical protein